jgi:hypothetical protein
VCAPTMWRPTRSSSRRTRAGTSRR